MRLIDQKKERVPIKGIINWHFFLIVDSLLLNINKNGKIMEG
jgi:hypothetical protein